MLHRSRLVTLAKMAKGHGGLDSMFRYNPVVRRHVQRTIAAFDSADFAERQRLTAEMTAHVLQRAQQTRYGRGRGPIDRDWPVLPRLLLRDAEDDFARPGLLRIPAATSGTSGIPARLWRGLTSVAAEQAFLDHTLRPLGMTWATARVASLRPHATKSTFDWSPPFGVETHRRRRLVLSGPHLAAATLPWFLDRLAEFRPDILWITPTTGAALMSLMQQSNRTLRHPPAVVLTSSARLEPVLRRAMEQEWRATVFDYYGQAERVCFAAASRAGEFWFQPAYGRVELLPSTSDEMVDGMRHVAIVATGFWNTAMPLVRYDTGDRAIVPADAAMHDLQAIALGIRSFHGIAGRSNEFLVAPDGTRVGGLNCVPWEVDNLLQLQIEQEASDRVVLRAIIRPAFSMADRARLEANARAKIPGSMAIRVEVVDRLTATPQGKTPFVIRQIDPQSVPPIRAPAPAS